MQCDVYYLSVVLFLLMQVNCGARVGQDGDMAAKELLICTVVLCALTACTQCDDIIVKPTKTGTDEIALIFIQGAQITPHQYLPLVLAIQKTSQYSLWVGIPDFAFHTPEPIVISGGISRVLKNMSASGMNTTKIFYAAHSLGGIMLQDYLHSNPASGVAQILMGSFLLRSYRGAAFPLPTLTIGGELDGLCRVTRIMEEYYHRILNSSSMDTAVKNFPVAVVMGMTHFQFCSSNPPAFVKSHDLKPEISFDEAHSLVASLVSAFISLHMGNLSLLSTLSTAVQTAGKFFQPLIDAYELEGFYNFNPPCYDNLPSPACTAGCPWSQYAQQVMGGLTHAKLIDMDAFHPVSQINPIHLPHILNNCSSPSPDCEIKTVTVSQNVYKEVDKLDTAFFSTSANEIRVKLKARQAVMEAAGYHNVSFNVSDGSSICKVINQQAYDWALQNASSNTRARFLEFGVQLVMAEDKGPYNVGPLWIWTPLSYSKSTNSTGGEIMEVQSVMLRTPTDYPIKSAAGMHYCKLLSPARAMEWIYVDGLRKYYSI